MRKVLVGLTWLTVIAVILYVDLYVLLYHGIINIVEGIQTGDGSEIAMGIVMIVVRTAVSALVAFVGLLIGSGITALLLGKKFDPRNQLRNWR